MADAVAVEPPPQEMAILAAEVAAEEEEMVVAAAEEVAAEEGEEDMIIAAAEEIAAEEGEEEEVAAAAAAEEDVAPRRSYTHGVKEPEGTNKFIYFLLYLFLLRGIIKHNIYFHHDIMP